MAGINTCLKLSPWLEGLRGGVLGMAVESGQGSLQSVETGTLSLLEPWLGQVNKRKGILSGLGAGSFDPSFETFELL